MKNRNHSQKSPKVMFLVFLVFFIITIDALLAYRTFKVQSVTDGSQNKVKPITVEEITHGDASKKQVIFTFDAGSGNVSAGKILQALEKHHARGTFFVTGKWIEKNPILIKKIVAAGHEIFNHTYDHPHLTRLPDDSIIEELKSADKALQTVAAVSAKPYFRPPYGDRDARVLSVASKEGYRSVYWSLDALDWKTFPEMTDAEVEDRILSHVQPGEIYLMHVGDRITGSILDDVFTAIESRGYKLVSLTQGF